jgi:3-hydroxyacyl-[acyl-carrier-protein] dehydratase
VRLEYFSMIDRVQALDVAGGLIEATATVPMASPVFEGHFPGYPIVPGVLLIETMAQACGYLLLARQGFARMVFLAQVKEGKLRQFVAPGTVLTVAGKVVYEGQGYAVAEGSIQAGGKPVADAEMRFRTLPFPVEELRGQMLLRAREVGVTP